MQVGVWTQHREFRKEILQAMQVGVVGPNDKK
ncbi:nitrogen fixation protein NifR, partial [Staphylococcus aureus]